MLFEQSSHRGKCLPGSNEIVEHDDVTLFRQNIQRKHSIHSLFGATRSHIFVEWNAELLGDHFRDTSCKVLRQMSAFRRGNHSPIAIRQIVPEHFLYNRNNAISEELHHIIISLYFSKRATIKRLLPNGDKVHI